MRVFFNRSLPYEWIQSAVGAAIADKDVGILVNNVGISYPYPKYFDELTDVEVRQAGKGCEVGVLCDAFPDRNRHPRICCKATA